MTYKALRRCQRLDMDGKQCRRTGTHKENYHGDGERSFDSGERDVPWVRVWLCEQHRITEKKLRKDEL